MRLAAFSPAQNRIFVLATLVIAQLCLAAESGTEGGQRHTRSFDIPSQSLSRALRSFAEQSDAQVLFSPTLVDGYTAAAIKGTFRPTAVLELLLEGTNLEFNYVREDMVTITARRVEPVAVKPEPQPPTPTDTAEDGSDYDNRAGYVTESVIVTATRRDVSMQDAGVAISLFDPDEFTDIGFDTLADVISYTPGATWVFFGHPGVGEITMRGISQEAGAPIVGLYVDDVPITTAAPISAGDLFVFDGVLNEIERIELVKGPQGTLFGANSVGGVARYVTRDPSMKEVRGSLSAEVAAISGGGSSMKYRGALSFPIVPDRVGVTLSGYFADRGGYVDRVAGVVPAESNVNGDESEGLNLTALWDVSDTVSLKLNVLHGETDWDHSGLVPYNHPDNAVFDPSQTALTPTFGDFKTNEQPSPNTIKYDNFALSLTSELDWATLNGTVARVEFQTESVQDLTSVLGPISDDLDPTGAPHTASNSAAAGYKKDVFELRLTSPMSEQFEWLAGVFYTEEDSRNNQQLDASPQIPGLNLGTFEFPGRYEELSFFASGTYYMTPDFDVSAGIRLTDTELLIDVTQAGLLAYDPSLDPDLDGISTLKETADERLETYMLGVRRRLNEETSLYFRAASGFRPAFVNLPAVNPFTGEAAAPIIASDRMWSYELGAKGRLASGKLTYDIAMWLLDWEDFQAHLTVGGLPTSGNSATAVNGRGFEGTFTYLPLDVLRIHASFAHTDSDIDGTDPALGARAGDQMRLVPEWTASIMAEYNFTFAGLSANIGAGVRHVGAFDVSFSDFPQFPVSASTRVNAHARIASENYALALYVTNLTNEHDLANASILEIISNPPGPISAMGYPVAPLTVGVNLSYRF